MRINTSLILLIASISVASSTPAPEWAVSEDEMLSFDPSYDEVGGPMEILHEAERVLQAGTAVNGTTTDPATVCLAYNEQFASSDFKMNCTCEAFNAAGTEVNCTTYEVSPCFLSPVQEHVKNNMFALAFISVTQIRKGKSTLTLSLLGNLQRRSNLLL
jgi:hypothetical protein